MPEERTRQRPRVVSYWLILLEAAILRSLRRSLAPFKISEIQFIILDTCFRGEANTVSSIARLAHYDPSVVSRHVERLRSRGLLETLRLKRDRRVVQLSVTEEGRLLREQLLVAAIEADDAITQYLDPGEHETLREIMKKLVMTLEEQR